jgi:hypothetical protein
MEASNFFDAVMTPFDCRYLWWKLVHYRIDVHDYYTTLWLVASRDR